MFNLEIMYKDLTTDTHNYSTFKNKMDKYISKVQNSINPRTLGLLKNYDLNYDEFCQRFVDFEGKTGFMQSAYDEFIKEFCIRLDTVQSTLS